MGPLPLHISYNDISIGVVLCNVIVISRNESIGSIVNGAW